MGEWKPIESAPKDGSPFFIQQDGEIFVARYTRDLVPRLCYRMHGLRVESQYRIVKTEMDGRVVEAQVPINQPWREVYEHNWVMWTRGYQFSPAQWAPIPPRPEPPDA